MNFRMSRTVLGATTALVAGIALATPASATITPPGGAWDHIVTTRDAAPHGGTVYIQEYGDVIDLCDTDADGLAPTVQINYTLDGIPYHYGMTASGGYGSCVVRSASDGGVYNLPENTEIIVTVYLGNYDYTFSGPYVNDH